MFWEIVIDSTNCGPRLSRPRHRAFSLSRRPVLARRQSVHRQFVFRWRKLRAAKLGGGFRLRWKGLRQQRQWNLAPLFLDPFALCDGEVIWEGDLVDDLDDDWSDAG